MKNKIHIASLVSLLSVFTLVACKPQSPDVSTTEKESDPLNAIQMLATKPTDALSVNAALQQLEPGDAATVMGQIGGAEDCFLEGYAGFVLADTDIMFCNEMGDDHCSTPWDACCEDFDKVKTSRASVQFVDADGRSLPGNIIGFRGLEGLSHVVVKGTVAQASTPDNLIIHAESLYVGEE